ncbi:hypothetical protein Q7P37_010478 [Cladosporium fusiforme]
MTSPKTINPSQLFNMPTPADNIQSIDPSLLEADNLDLDIDNFNFDDIPNFDQRSGYDDSSIQGAASSLGFGTANALQPYTQAPQQTFPMQQQINPSPVTLTPTQVLPTPPPGLAYHPQVGWYYPANAPAAGVSTGFMTPQIAPPQMMAPYAMPQVPAVAQAPVPPVPMFDESSAVQTVANKKKRGSSGGSSRVSPRTKRKYGPSAYLEEQAKRRAEGDDSGPRPVSRDSIDFHYDSRPKSTRPSPRASAKRAPAGKTVSYQAPVENTGEKMKELKTATMQKCSCPAAAAAEARHIPRPRNEFMIFRNDFAARWRTGHGEKRGLHNPDISKEAGKAWQALKANDKAAWAKYKARANTEKKQHEQRYPDYKYTPLKKIQACFGEPSCSCGAYKINLAELQRLREGAPTPENKFTGAVSDSEGEYIAPRTRSQSRGDIHAPTAQMFPFTFGQEEVDFGFGLESQNNTATMEWGAIHAFNAVNDDDSDQPVAKRRSGRTTSKTVRYAEVDEEDEEEDIHVAFTTPRKHRPAPISTSRKPSSNLSEINSADFLLLIEDEGPATRTRSKSITDAAMAEPETGNSNTSSMNSLFGVDDDTIVVSPAKTKLALPAKGSMKTRSQSRGRKRQRS